MYKFYLLVLLVASASALDISLSKSDSKIQPRGIITPAPNCSAVGEFKQLEITSCTKFPCDIVSSTKLDLTFIPTRATAAQLRLTFTLTNGTVLPVIVQDINGNIAPPSTKLTLDRFSVLTQINDAGYVIRVEVLSKNIVPTEVQACVFGAVNWKVKASLNGSSGPASASIFGVLTLALMTLWKIM